MSVSANNIPMSDPVPSGDASTASAATAGAAGWQSNAHSREVYDEADLLYSSDTRGESPFFPRIGGKVFRTLEIPSTLPTFDELMGRPEYPDDRIVAHYLSLLRADRLNVLTTHAELEGMGRRELFRELLAACRAQGVEFVGSKPREFQRHVAVEVEKWAHVVRASGARVD